MNRIRLENRLPELIGKTIKRVLYCLPEDESIMPAQVFFEFTDGTSYEIYGRAEFFFTGLRYPSDLLNNSYKMAGTNTKICVMADKKGVNFSDREYINTREGWLNKLLNLLKRRVI